MYLYRIHREIIARNPIEHGCKNGYEHALCAEVRIKFSFPELVVSWPVLKRGALEAAVT